MVRSRRSRSSAYTLSSLRLDLSTDYYPRLVLLCRTILVSYIYLSRNSSETVSTPPLSTASNLTHPIPRIRYLLKLRYPYYQVLETSRADASR